MIINSIFNVNLLENIQFIQSILLLVLFLYFILLLLDSNNYLKILIFFEIIMLLITILFLINIYENIDYIVFLLLVIIGAESGLALSVIFPFLIK